jgi:hypothetical protein
MRVHQLFLFLQESCKEAGLERNIEKTKYMLLFRHEKAGENRYIKIVNRLFGSAQIFGDDSNLLS